MDLQGKVAVVTGASSGIGTAVARNLNDSGVKLVVTARREQRLKELASELNEADYLAGDITDPEMPENLIERAVSRFGCCDFVINNAGILVVGPVDQIDLEKVTQMVRINVEATFRMAYEAVRHFKSEGSGHLVNVSSILGTKTRPNAGAYAGTKFAVEALSESLRLELAGTGIQVSCIQPGLVITELHKDWPVHPTETFNIKAPLVPEDIARGIRFVLEQPPHVRVSKMMILPEESPL
jgi:NADP-dependent 3-hydroxy acid dehydrogenase YdfG